MLIAPELLTRASLARPSDQSFPFQKKRRLLPGAQPRVRSGPPQTLQAVLRREVLAHSSKSVAELRQTLPEMKRSPPLLPQRPGCLRHPEPVRRLSMPSPVRSE